MLFLAFGLKTKDKLMKYIRHMGQQEHVCLERDSIGTRTTTVAGFGFIRSEDATQESQNTFQRIDTNTRRILRHLRRIHYRSSATVACGETRNHRHDNRWRQRMDAMRGCSNGAEPT